MQIEDPVNERYGGSALRYMYGKRLLKRYSVARTIMDRALPFIGAEAGTAPHRLCDVRLGLNASAKFKNHASRRVTYRVKYHPHGDSAPAMKP